MLTQVIKTFENCLRQTWLLLAYGVLCYGYYEKAVEKQRQEYETFSTQYQTLLLQKAHAFNHQMDLKLQINSQSDPAFVTLVLMKGLGVVPEGQTKIFFNKQL